MILSGEQIGVLGGGQLGMFFAESARRMGYRVVIWDPDPKAPARFVADRFISAPFNQKGSLQSFLDETKGVTYEWENIPVEIVSEIEKNVIVCPGSAVLGLLQNRITQKNFLREHQFPVAPYDTVNDPLTLPDKIKGLGLSCIVKTAVSGYDGQGQWVVTEMGQVVALSGQFEKYPCPAGWIVEKKIDLRQEFSVIVVIGESFEAISYPIAENIHEHGILRMSAVPAKINSDLANRVASLGVNVVSALKSKGVFCVEMFLTESGELLVNEIAPRPHNSGHYTMDVCPVSQYEQQVRVLCGLPVMPSQLLSPCVLVNILGGEIERLTQEWGHMKKTISTQDIRFHDYRKETIKPGRKMGHLLIVDPDFEKAMEEAKRIVKLFKTTR
ncbi:MAG: 5-(carboxyamino)imidazole ribonucleotide synthase [Nitrospirota bacterium]